ncbi:F-box domain-containing protein [Heracleum sosnowskyi]|uniref:F-box domain-containing protein n=1 Tax=Heracleum sosnowskyi TaxID=360622 RepID=A0AAD8M113_9APIA|nr:F-box domain-containing protein [Heracleum sosnowskyi]
MSLPNELIDEILYRVPVKYLLRCRCVSKEWCSIIDSNAFIIKHSKRTSECNLDSGVVISGDGKVFLTDVEALRDDNVDVIELDDGFVSGAKFVGVSNGLICLCKENKSEFVVCNPSTRKYRKLPRAPRVFVREFEGVEVPLCGFGYDRVNDDYKVVKIGKCEECTVVVVYSLKSNSWKQIQDIGSNVHFIPEQGKFVGGALHWMTIKYPRTCCGIVFGIDLGLEKYKEDPFPDVHGTFVCLVYVGESLCITDNYSESHTDVWLMKNHGEGNSWYKSFTVEQPGPFGAFKFIRPVALSNNNKDVLLEVDRKKLLWYDLEKKSVKNVTINGIPVKFHTHLYSESLFQLAEAKQLQKQKPKLSEDKKQKKQQKKGDDFLSKGFKLKL